MKNKHYISPHKYCRSVEKIRLNVMNHLVNGFINGEDVLELFNGINSIAQIMDTSKFKKFIRLDKHPAPATPSLANMEIFSIDKLSSTAFKDSFTDIIWFNGLNWVQPQQEEYLLNCWHSLKPKGILHISFAGKTLFPSQQDEIELQVGNLIRKKSGFKETKNDFESMRIHENELYNLFKKFSVIRYEKIESNIFFKDLKTFSDWHGGSTNSLFSDLEPTAQANIKKDFLLELFQMHLARSYIPKLATCMLNAQK